MTEWFTGKVNKTNDNNKIKFIIFIREWITILNGYMYKVKAFIKKKH